MTSSQFRILLFSLLAAQALGFGLLWWNQDFVPSSASDGALTEAVLEELRQVRSLREDMDAGVPQTAIALPEAEALRSLVRQVLEEELASLDVSGGGPEARMDETPSMPDLAQQLRSEEAFAQSNVLLDQAIQSGVWSESDTLALLPLLADMSSEQIDQLSRKLNDALGRKGMQLEGPPPPL